MNNSSIKDLKVKSSAFQNGEMIPSEYTFDGKNISPDLSWKGAPPGVKSYAILVEDPDISANEIRRAGFQHIDSIFLIEMN